MPSNKRRGLRASSHNLSNGARKSARKGGYVFLIICNTGQALLLGSPRFLRPRMSRGLSAEPPRSFIGSRPRQQPFRERDLAQHRAHPRAVPVREQSASASSPRQPARQQSVRVREQDAAGTGRDLARPVDANSPRTGRSTGPSRSAAPARTDFGRALAAATNCPRSRITVGTTPATKFSVQFRKFPSHVLV